MDVFRTVPEKVKKSRENSMLGINSTLDVLMEVFEHEPSTLKEHVAMLRGVLLGYCRIYHESEAFMDAFKKTEDSSKEEETRDELVDLSDFMEKELKSAITALNLEEHDRTCPYLLEFERIVSTLSKKIPAMEALNENEDMVVSEEIASLICPFTQKTFVDPVKSKVCGHVYSREAVALHISTLRNRARCPHIGCTNKQLTVNQLESDRVTLLHLRRRSHVAGKTPST